MNDNNDDFKLDLSNVKIEVPKTDYSPTTEETTTETKEDAKKETRKETKNVNSSKNLNNNSFVKKKSNMKAGTKTQLIILGITLIFWIFLASGVISFIRSIGRGLKRPKNYYTQVNYNTNQTAPEPQTTVVEPVTTTEVAPAPVTTVPEPVNNTNVPQSIPETNNNVAPQQNTVNQVQNAQQYSAYDDYDLQVLEQVYDEVINRGNESYLYNFSSSELAIIRNTLYARRGYRFKKKKYQQYFGSKPWYKPTTDSQNILPKNEERLANIIKKYE